MKCGGLGVGGALGSPFRSDSSFSKARKNRSKSGSGENPGIFRDGWGRSSGGLPWPPWLASPASGGKKSGKNLSNHTNLAKMAQNPRSRTGSKSTFFSRPFSRLGAVGHPKAAVVQSYRGSRSNHGEQLAAVRGSELYVSCQGCGRGRKEQE